MNRDSFLPGQLRLILLIALVHAITWFAYYGQIPIGLYPGPEEAAAIQAALTGTGGAPHSLYQGILNLLAKFAGTAHGLTIAARSLNALALVVSTGLCAASSGHFWKRNRTVWITGLLVGLNPVLVFWAGEVSPALLAVTCVAAALWRLLHWLRHPHPLDCLWIGLALALGAAFQPVLLGPAALWPLFALLAARHERPAHLVMAALGPLLIGGSLLLSGLQLQYPVHTDLTDFGSKLYAFCNNVESYDGKTYGLHSRINLPLFLNPIHWGLLFVLAMVGCYARFKDGRQRRSIFAFLLIFALVAAASTLIGGSSRARLTLVPLLAVFAGGIALIPQIWYHAGNQTKRRIIFIGLLSGGLTYSAFYGIGSTASRESDYAFMAQANIALGHNEEATIWAEKTLELNPNREDMQTVLVQAEFNEWALGSKPKPLAIETTREYLARAATAETEAPLVSVIEGIYQWKLHDSDSAVAIWKAHAKENALATICLFWTGQAPKPTPEAIETYQDAPHYALLKAAAEVDRNSASYEEIEKLIDNLVAYAY